MDRESASDPLNIHAIMDVDEVSLQPAAVAGSPVVPFNSIGPTTIEVTDVTTPSVSTSVSNGAPSSVGPSGSVIHTSDNPLNAPSAPQDPPATHHVGSVVRAATSPASDGAQPETPVSTRLSRAPSAGKLKKGDVINWTGRCMKLGSGATAKVYLTLDNNTGTLIVIKHFSFDPKLKSWRERIGAFKQELAVLKDFEHPNIVTFYRTSHVGVDYYLFMEHVGGGSLRHILDCAGALEEHVAAGYVAQLLQGLQFLHDHNIVHCDIKAENLLLAPSGTVKITDFGSARYKRNNGDPEHVGSGGTTNWMAPEAVRGKTPTPAVDIWSVGCVVIELLTRQIPFGHMGESMFVFNYLGGLKEDSNVCDDLKDTLSQLSKEARSFVESCLNPNPLARPTAKALLAHDFVKAVQKDHNSSEVSSLVSFISTALSSEFGASRPGSVRPQPQPPNQALQPPIGSLPSSWATTVTHSSDAGELPVRRLSIASSRSTQSGQPGAAWVSAAAPRQSIRDTTILAALDRAGCTVEELSKVTGGEIVASSENDDTASLMLADPIRDVDVNKVLVRHLLAKLDTDGPDIVVCPAYIADVERGENPDVTPPDGKSDSWSAIACCCTEDVVDASAPSAPIPVRAPPETRAPAAPNQSGQTVLPMPSVPNDSANVRTVTTFLCHHWCFMMLALVLVVGITVVVVLAVLKKL